MSLTKEEIDNLLQSWMDENCKHRYKWRTPAQQAKVRKCLERNWVDDNFPETDSPEVRELRAKAFDEAMAVPWDEDPYLDIMDRDLADLDRDIHLLDKELEDNDKDMLQAYAQIDKMGAAVDKSLERLMRRSDKLMRDLGG